VEPVLPVVDRVEVVEVAAALAGAEVEVDVELLAWQAETSAHTTIPRPNRA
jgi:hypothetical protein